MTVNDGDDGFLIEVSVNIRIEDNVHHDFPQRSEHVDRNVIAGTILPTCFGNAQQSMVPISQPLSVIGLNDLFVGFLANWVVH